MWTAALLRLGIAEHQWGEHLALIIWRQTAPPRSLPSATQSSGSGTTLPAFPYTGSSAWAGDGSRVIHFEWTRTPFPPGVCFQMNQWWEWPRGETDAFLLCGPAVRKSALRGSASSSSSAPEINPEPERRAEILTEPPVRGNQILSLKISSTLPVWDPQLLDDTHMLLCNTWVSSLWQKDVLCFWIHGRLIYQLLS